MEVSHLHLTILLVCVKVHLQIFLLLKPSFAWTTTKIINNPTGSRYFPSSGRKNASLRLCHKRQPFKQKHRYAALFSASTDGSISSPKASAYSSSAPVLSIENLSCTHDGGETYQLRNVNFNLQRGAKAALIGRNGTGKSTLLRILHESYLMTNNIMSSSSSSSSSSSDYKYTGEVQIPKIVRISMVDQEPPIPTDVTVDDAILGIDNKNNSFDSNVFLSSTTSTRNQMDVVRRYVTLSRYAAAVDDNYEGNNYDPNLFVEASADMDSFNGWEVLTKSEEIATKLKVQHLRDEPLSNLSGGERKRVALCGALVESPDVLLLDEPTNFLSLAGVEWLGDLLTERRLTILMVTHDRAFLQQTCDRIIELDRGSLYEHPGSYSSYLQAKEERLAAEDQAIQSAKSKYKVELDWMRRQPQARESKSKARIDAFYKLEKATKPRPRDPSLDLIQISDGSTRRIGSKIVSMKSVTLTFPSVAAAAAANDDDDDDDALLENSIDERRMMLDNFSYDFFFGDRICIAGMNGVGKSTFLKVITGEIEPDAGIIEVGDTVVLGVYDQLGLKFDAVAESQTVLEYVVDQIEATDANEARKLLKEFEFERNRWNERIRVLSGGERRRLQLLSVLSVKPNFLILDEPSVDCDLDTLSALENYLTQFQGVLLIVSHDRSFADKVTDHLFVFEGDGIVKDFRGSLSEYGSCLVELENQKIQQSVDFKALNGNNTFSNSDDISKKINYKEERAKRNEIRNFVRQSKKEMLNIERALEKLKPKASDVQSDIDGASTDEGWSVLADLTDKLNNINDEIDTKETRWLELAEQIEEIDFEEP